LWTGLALSLSLIGAVLLTVWSSRSAKFVDVQLQMAAGYDRST
jgi:hypothetical protein